MVEHTWDVEGGRIGVIFFRDEGREERMALVQSQAGRAVWAGNDPARLALLDRIILPEWRRDSARAVLPAWVAEALLAGLPEAAAGEEAEPAPGTAGVCCWLARFWGDPPTVGDPPFPGGAPP